MEESGVKVVTDKTLQWMDFDPVALKIPQDIFYQSTTADSSSSSGFSFYIVSPASNALMDNEAYIEYSVRVYSIVQHDLTGQFEDITNNAQPDAVNANRTALRQCWAVARSIQNLSLNINGTVISGQPVLSLDTLNRMYISEEEAASLCTLSGGEFDSGPRIARAYDDLVTVSTSLQDVNGLSNINANDLFERVNIHPGYGPLIQGSVDAAVALNTWNYAPHNKQYYNDGFTQRHHRFANLCRAVNAPNAAIGAARYATDQVLDGNGYADYVDITIYERVPLCPFFFYDSRDYKMSIPHVRTMTLSSQFSTNYSNLIMQVASGANIFVNPVYAAPKLHLKWIMTKDPIPPSISIPCPITREYTLSFTAAFPAAAASSASGTTQWSGLNLEAIPDLLCVSLKRQPGSETSAAPTEHFLEITNIKLTVAGTSGKMTNISSGELYALWLSNVVHRGIYKQNYQEWRKYACVAALRPKDYGAMFGPGFDYPVQINIEISYTNWWNIPAFLGGARIAVDDNTTTAYYITVVAFYSRFSLELNSGGGSKLQMLRLPVGAVALPGTYGSNAIM